MPVWIVEAIQAFLSSGWGGMALLLLGAVVELLFALALFHWKPIGFINAWIALMMVMLLALSSDQRTLALMLAALVTLNLIDIPLVAAIRSWLKKKNSMQKGES